ncbi:hypothetical protein [Vreelandella boliviensis]|uniref:DUF3068 domain-containing protein n=1 Tax=Vreelandella boliviensis LC1 TaxID=1072583 RepID=A0A265E1N5_9GAMM|nr:hypothetical protein [Halomonas boliviensis]EHJ94649.1 hypothetical protein KUC_1608 [Halomonas boliviensis LC1]OZT75512.1 hypothetical protein CE457_03720 [Halomonas boliviensis LC1]
MKSLLNWFAKLNLIGRGNKKKEQRACDKPIRWHPAVVLILSLVLLLFVVYVLVEILRKPSTFHIVADTEVLDMVTTGVSATRWYAQQVDATLGEADPLNDSLIDSFAFSGLIEIGPRSNVRMVRYGSGSMHITLQTYESNESTPLRESLSIQDDALQRTESVGADNQSSRAIPVITLENQVTEKVTWHWGDSASLRVHIGDLPFSGSLLAVGAIGSETYAASSGEPPPVLRAGSVVVMEKRLLSELRYPVMELDLQLGDEVWVTDATGKSADTACVFSATEQEATGIKVACHATGKTLNVSRFGGYLLKMEPGPWDIILAEPTLQIMIPLLFSLIYLLLRWLFKLTFPGRSLRLSASPEE